MPEELYARDDQVFIRMAPTLRLRRRSLVIETVVTRWRRGARGGVADVAFEGSDGDETRRDETDASVITARRDDDRTCPKRKLEDPSIHPRRALRPGRGCGVLRYETSARTRSVRLTDTRVSPTLLSRRILVRIRWIQHVRRCRCRRSSFRRRFRYYGRKLLQEEDAPCARC